MTTKKVIAASVIAAGALFSATGNVQAAVTVHTTDFIPDGSRTGFNGFESIPNDGTFYTGGAGPYTEGGISVTQINGDSGNDIWVTYRPPGGEGAFGWYPNGGDGGYTRITLSGGGDFANVGMLVGSGYGGDAANPGAFELWEGATLIDSGTFAHTTAFHYLGFSGGGFDTILLRDGSSAFTFYDGTTNAITVDGIEISRAVPEPETYAMLLAGLGLLGFAARRRKQLAAA